MTARLGERPIVAALLAGGKGTRFWPASRAATPKQFLRLFGDRSLLQLTFERFRRVTQADRILVVTNPTYAAQARAELPELPAENLVLEPWGRDTAPAAALAAHAAGERYDDPLVIVAPTDHFIQDEARFVEALALGVAAAETGALVTFGVVPDGPATIYGYIEVAAGGDAPGGARRVQRFHEKPGAAVAAEYVASGRFFWNAGIFLWRTSVFWKELLAADPALGARLSALPAPGAPGFEEAWDALPATSIDYALMEKSSSVMVVPLAAGWNDVGGWDAVRQLLPADDAGNRPAAEVLYVGARGCSVHRHGSSPRRLYALVGTEDLILVETDDAVLVCRRGAGETLREVVKRLEAMGRRDLL